MEATVKNYPELFSKLKLRVKTLLKKNNIKVIQKKYRSNVGKAWADERRIKIPIITDIESVYVILHEIGHVVLGHGTESNKPLYLEELEAELYALNILKKWSINKFFPNDYNIIKQRAQRYIRWNILYTIQRSLYEDSPVLQLKHIHVVALRFSQIKKFQTPAFRAKTKKKRK